MSETPEEQTEQTEPEPETPSVPEPTPDEEEEEEEAEQPLAPPEPEQPQAQGPSQAELEQQFKKAEQSFATYTRRVTDLWGDDAPALIAFNFSPSAPPGFLSAQDAGRIPEESKAGLLEWLGFAREQDYEPDPQTRECGTCKGKGKTQTGSHVPGRETRPCPTCNGSGAEGLTAAPVAVTGNGQTGEPFTLAEPASAAAPDADNWDEPRILPDGRENPNYGRQPQYKVPVEPWGLTAGLGVQDVAAGG